MNAGAHAIRWRMNARRFLFASLLTVCSAPGLNAESAPVAAESNGAANGESVSQSSASAATTTNNVDTNTGTAGSTDDTTSASSRGETTPSETGTNSKATDADPASPKGAR